MTNWLLEYPRSGGNWVQYIVQTITGLQLKKTHLYNNDTRIQEDDTIIFLIRNYKEAITRHMEISAFEDFKIVLAMDQGSQHPDYMYVLDFYDKFKGKKFLVYYEDLILQYQKEIMKILGFYNHKGIGKLEKFLSFYKEHIAISINLLTIKSGSSITYGDPEKLIYHSKKLNSKVIQFIDEYIMENYYCLFDKYLRRYV